MFTILFYLSATVITLLVLIPFFFTFLVTLPFDSQRVVLHRFSRLWSSAFFGLQPRWKVSVEGLENIDRNKAYVITVNHNSMLDIPIMYNIPLNFKWVSKREVYKMPIFGWVLRMHGDIAIDRGSKAAAKKMIGEACGWLSQGTSVIIFPEGTRSRNGDMLKFKDGAFLMARQGGVDILPCVVDGTGDVVYNKWRLHYRHKFTVRVLPPVSRELIAKSDLHELAQSVRATMVEQYEQIHKLRLKQ